MRLHLHLLSAVDADHRLPVVDATGVERSQLWMAACRWACADGELAFRLIASEAQVVPESESSEPQAAALARVVRGMRGSGSLVLLEQPSAFGQERIPLTEGARLFAVEADDDLACWDAMLSTGQPVYGVRGQQTIETMSAHPASVLSALAYGLFTCDEGLTLTGLHEDRAGVAYVAPHDTTATVIIRGGFEAGELRGRAGETVTWKDRGSEAVVRLVIRSADGQCFTQPRFVVPSAAQSSHG